MNPEPRLLTARLELRPPALSDFGGFAMLMADREARFIGGPLGRPLAWRNFLTMAGAWALQGFGMFSVLDRTSGAWVGRAGPWAPEGWPGVEFGWALLPERRGEGLALEAARAALEWTWATLPLGDVVHCIHPENHASERLAARLGARREGAVRLPPPFDHQPHDLWRLSRS